MSGARRISSVLAIVAAVCGMAMLAGEARAEENAFQQACKVFEGKYEEKREGCDPDCVVTYICRFDDGSGRVCDESGSCSALAGAGAPAAAAAGGGAEASAPAAGSEAGGAAQAAPSCDECQSQCKERCGNARGPMKKKCESACEQKCESACKGSGQPEGGQG